MNKKEKAKTVSIIELYPGELRKMGGIYRGKCIFHNDINKPNLTLYPETNSWFCFAGCGGGDNISFYMRLKNIDFKQALEDLTNDF